MSRIRNNGSPELQVVHAVGEWERLQSRNMRFFFETLNKTISIATIIVYCSADIFVQLMIHHNRISVSRMFKNVFDLQCPVMHQLS